MIVKNEEAVLERCLKCVMQFADEVVIVDTGSSDLTKEIAKRYSENVYDFVWEDDFSTARNYAFSKATKTYCMWVDADDVIKQEEIEKIQKLKETMGKEVDMVMCHYDTAFDEKGNSLFSYYRERIIKNDPKYQWVGKIHEVIVPTGVLLYSDIHICHHKVVVNDKDRNLRIYETMKKEQELEPRDQFYYAKELLEHERYEDCMKQLHQFLKEGRGWVEDEIQATILLAECCFKLGKRNQGIHSLFRSFLYDEPRAEVCCSIGKYFFEENKYEQAIYWYYCASRCDKNRIQGFVNPDAYDFIPYLQLCVCYDHLHQYEKAQMYNEMAGSVKPMHASYLYNKEYFEKMLGI